MPHVRRIFRKREWLLAMAAGLIGLLYTLVVSHYINSRSHEETQSEFQMASNQLAFSVQRRLELSLRTMRGLRGLLATNDGRITERDLQLYLLARNFKDEFPGVIGFGFIRRVPAVRVDDYLSENRAKVPGFHPPRQGGHAGDRYIAEIVVPAGGSREAMTLDLANDGIRRVAEQAMHRGDAVFFGPYVPEGAEPDDVHALALMPYFRGGVIPDTREAREQNLEGWLYAPIRIRLVMRGLKQMVDGQALDLELFLGDQMSKETLLYDSEFQDVEVWHSNYRRMIAHTLPLEVGGQQFTLQVATPPGFVADSQRDVTVLVTMAGGLISLFLIWTVWSLWAVGRTRQLALTWAEKMSARAHDREAQLDAVFNNTAESIITVDQTGGGSFAEQGGSVPLWLSPGRARRAQCGAAAGLRGVY